MLRAVGGGLVRALLAAPPEGPLLARRLVIQALHPRLYCAQAPPAEKEPSPGPSLALAPPPAKEPSPGPAVEEATAASLLQSARQFQGDGTIHFSKASSIVSSLAALRRSGQAVETDYAGTANFDLVLAALEGPAVRRMEPLAAIGCLKSLTELGVDDEHFTVKNLENMLVWASRSCPIKDLVMMLSFSVGRRRTDSQRVFFDEVCKALERRWVEIRDGKIFCGLLHYSEQFTPQFLARLEDRLADLVDEFPPAELAAVLKALALKGRRNVPLLKTVSWHLTRHRGQLDIKQLADSLFALKQLNFKDAVTLERLCSELEGRVPAAEGSAVLRSVLVSLGQLRFLSPGLLDAVCAWAEGREEQLEERDIATLLITLANLNYRPPRHMDLLQRLAARLEAEQFRHLARYEQVWTDVVWSLVALRLAAPRHIESVLNSGFHSQLLYSGETRSLGATLKLLNINAAAGSLFPEYRGPVLQVAEDALLRDLRAAPSLHRQQFCQTVLEAFASIAPPPRFLALNVNTPLGCQIDAELACDAQGRPLPVDLPLPEGATKVALLAAGFHDCIVSGGESGSVALHRRLLEAAGWRVLLVRHDMLAGETALVARVKLLERLLRETLGLGPAAEPTPS